MENQVLDLFSLNETRLDSTISDNEILIDGYNVIRRDRSRHGGGIAIYIRKTIDYKVRTDLIDNDLEFLPIEIRKPGIRPFLISSWYRPPSSPVEIFDKFEILLGKIESEGIESSIIGDMNCNFLSDTDNNTRHLKSLCDLYQYTQLINEPTRITCSSSTLIDLFLTNEPGSFSSPGTSNIGISDHGLIYVCRKTLSQKSATTTVESRQYGKFQSDSFINDINSQSWISVENISDPTLAWDAWKLLFLSVTDNHAPVKKKRIRNLKAPWLSIDIKKQMWERDRIKRAAIISCDQTLWSKFKSAKNKVNHAIKSAKKNYFESYFSQNKGDIKGTWKGINSVLSRKKNTSKISTINVDNIKISDPEVISNAFNSHFVNIGPSLASKVCTPNATFDQYLNPSETVFDLSKITVDEVIKLIDNLPSGKSEGLDGVPTKLIKLVTPTIASSLTHIFNRVIETGCIPNDWKTARVSPIFKDGSRSDLGNYRPISVLPVISKVFEKAIFNQTYEYLQENKTLARFQSGFRPMHSTLTALLDSTNSWYLNMDNGLTNAILFIDLKKAFDTIDHDILLSKMSSYGFHGQSLDLFKNYLSNRSQCTVVNNVKSEVGNLRCGVPQGSILGPLLFLLYINDLPNCNLYSVARMYADDTNLTYAAKDLESLYPPMNHDLKELKEWLDANKLSLNVMKTKCMFIGTRQKVSSIPEKLEIGLNDTHIERVKTYKCLGLHLDQHLTWEIHISEVSAKIAKGLGVLRRLKPIFPQEVLITIYNSLIVPYVDYCSAVWGNIGKGLSSKIQKMQNRAARIITGADYSVRSIDIRSDLHWLSLEERRSKQFKKLMFKTINNQVPEYLSEKFSRIDTVHKHSLRNSTVNVFVPRPQSEALKQSFSYRGAIVWNGLSSEAKRAPNLRNFINQI